MSRRPLRTIETCRASLWGSWAWCMPRCCDTCVARLDLQWLWGMWARPRARRLLPCSWAMAGGCQAHPEHCPPAAGIVLQAHGLPTCHLDHVPAIGPRGCWVGLRCRRPICDTHQPVAGHDHVHKCFDIIETCRASSWGSWAWRMPRCCDTCVARLDLQWLRGIWARPRARRLLPCSWAMAGGCQAHP